MATIKNSPASISELKGRKLARVTRFPGRDTKFARQGLVLLSKFFTLVNDFSWQSKLLFSRDLGFHANFDPLTSRRRHLALCWLPVNGLKRVGVESS